MAFCFPVVLFAHRQSSDPCPGCQQEKGCRFTSNPAAWRCTATTKTSKQTDYQRLAHDKGARQLNVTVKRVLALRGGQRLSKPYRSGVSGCSIARALPAWMIAGMATMTDFLSFLQGASNSAAATVSAPVDGINWLLKKAGVPVSDKPVGGSDWLKDKGLMAEPKNPLAGYIGEAVGGVATMLAGAYAPQIASRLVQMGENVRTPSRLNKEAGVLLFHGSKGNDLKYFDLNKVGSGARANTEGYGAYLSDSRKNAQRFGHLYEVDFPDEYASGLLHGEKKLIEQPHMLDIFRRNLLAKNAEDQAQNAWSWIRSNSSRAGMKPAYGVDQSLYDAVQKSVFTKQIGEKPVFDSVMFNAELNRRGIHPNVAANIKQKIGISDPGEMLGLDAYRALASQIHGSEKAASDVLDSAGVPGMIVSASRDLRSVDPSSNTYVLWSQDLLNGLPLKKK